MDSDGGRGALPRPRSGSSTPSRKLRGRGDTPQPVHTGGHLPKGAVLPLLPAKRGRGPGGGGPRPCRTPASRAEVLPLSRAVWKERGPGGEGPRAAGAVKACPRTTLHPTKTGPASRAGPAAHPSIRPRIHPPIRRRLVVPPASPPRRYDRSRASDAREAAPRLQSMYTGMPSSTTNSPENEYTGLATSRMSATPAAAIMYSAGTTG